MSEWIELVTQHLSNVDLQIRLLQFVVGVMFILWVLVIFVLLNHRNEICELRRELNARSKGAK